MQDMNIAIITLDSLRYDVACMASTPNIDNAASKFKENWEKVYAHATYTLPAHIALFHNGMLPSNRDDKIRFPYNTERIAVFRAPITEKEKQTVYPTPDAPNIVRGFGKIGYRTIGVGGVGWFRTDMSTSNFWQTDYFQEFYWNWNFYEANPNAFAEQIHLVSELQKDKRKWFFFLNVSATHFPYRKNLSRKRDGRIEHQVEALEYVDKYIPQLFNLFPKPCHVFLVADHGECFGETFPGSEKKLYGHNFYHEKVMEIPMTNFILTT